MVDWCGGQKQAGREEEEGGEERRRVALSLQREDPTSQAGRGKKDSRKSMMHASWEASWRPLRASRRPRGPPGGHLGHLGAVVGRLRPPLG
eukprot:3135737-Pyramimonas_sp.AAC.1